MNGPQDWEYFQSQLWPISNIRCKERNIGNFVPERFKHILCSTIDSNQGAITWLFAILRYNIQLVRFLDAAIIGLLGCDFASGGIQAESWAIYTPGFPLVGNLEMKRCGQWLSCLHPSPSSISCLLKPYFYHIQVCIRHSYSFFTISQTLPYISYRIHANCIFPFYLHAFDFDIRFWC